MQRTPCMEVHDTPREMKQIGKAKAFGMYKTRKTGYTWIFKGLSFHAEEFRFYFIGNQGFRVGFVFQKYQSGLQVL